MGWLGVAFLYLFAAASGATVEGIGNLEGLPPADVGLPPAAEGLPDVVTCTAEQTGGFHDYPGAEESYEPALFHPQTFTLEENEVFMMNLAAEEGNADLYLTMVRRLPAESPDGEETIDATELECRRVRGANESQGYSCVNLPPSEMLLINARTLRFTRTAVGGWTFTGASEAHNGDSIFVEYGQCVRNAP